MQYHLTTPVTREDLAPLKAGDTVLLSGVVYTARDAAHKRLMELLDAGKPLPFPLEGSAIYYVGPTPERPGQVIGSAGPTTSGRMDAYSPRLLDLGQSIMIGKGARNQAVKDAVVRSGAVYLADLAQAVVSGANAEYYATIVRDKSLQRGLINACSSIISNCYDASREVGSLLDESEQAVFAISQRTTGRDFTGARELVDSVFENLSKLADSRDVITGVTTGYTRLDKLTAGLQPSDLIIVAARPSMGKTAFSLCMGLNAAIRQGVPVAVFSLEMSKEQLMQRMLAVWGKVDMSKLRRPALLTDADWSNLYAAADVISRAPIYIDDTPALTTLELRARARRLKAEKGLGLVIVDYLQLMRTSRRTDSRELEISDISRSLKGLAKEMNVPVVALSQLNRKVEERKDNRPMLSDLRESGAIEQDADIVIFLYRDEVYKFTKPADRPVQGIAEIIIGKQRNGPVGVAELLYMSPYTAFEDLAPDWAPSETPQ